MDSVETYAETENEQAEVRRAVRYHNEKRMDELEAKGYLIYNPDGTRRGQPKTTLGQVV